jgi:hypothetical protein
MKKIISLLSLVILLSSAVNAQQKTKPTATTSAAKEKPQDPAVFQSIWNNNIYLGKMILEMEKPAFQKEMLHDFVNGEFTIKTFDQLKSIEQKFYSNLPLEIFLQDKLEAFKASIDKIESATSATELNNISLEIQQCINQSYFPSTWDYKLWLNGFNKK